MPHAPKVSVTIITKNEASDIAAALRSVAWADERIVVDSGSTDDTVALAQPLADRVVTHGWEGYGAQKNFAASLATHDWILSLDADERITPGLAAEVRRTLAGDDRHAGYRIPRVTHYLGRWIRSTDWYPDDQLRLYDRRRARWTTPRVHEGVSVDGTIGRLRGEIEHFAYRDIADHLETIDRYTTYAAQQMFDDGRRAGWLHLAAHPPLAFLRNYVVHRGVTDGIPGLVVSGLNAYYVFLKFAKLWELRTRRD